MWIVGNEHTIVHLSLSIDCFLFWLVQSHTFVFAFASFVQKKDAEAKERVLKHMPDQRRHALFSSSAWPNEQIHHKCFCCFELFALGAFVGPSDTSHPSIHPSRCFWGQSPMQVIRSIHVHGPTPPIIERVNQSNRCVRLQQIPHAPGPLPSTNPVESMLALPSWQCPSSNNSI